MLGFLAIAAILMVQLLWTKEAFNLEDKKFHQKVHVALLEVVKRLYDSNSYDLPQENPVENISNDYYIINVENDFDAQALEFYLKSEFEKFDIKTDFEYAIYQCESQAMVYGNYVSYDEKSSKKNSNYFPKKEGLVYYFAVRFPKKSQHLFASLKFWVALSTLLLAILLIYIYSIIVIIKQKKYSELQKDFINNMTHEFKTPLSSIILAADYLKSREEIFTDEKLAKYMSIISLQSSKLNVQIERILNLAKTENNSLELDLQKIDLIELTQKIKENFKTKFPETIINIEAETNFTILADEFHLINLINNLIENAIKYCDKKPEILIQLSNSKGKTKIEIIDNGPGIPPKHLPFIFDKFYRVNQKDNTRKPGFGLGLFYVKKIVDLHNWKITATSELKGSVFTIKI